MELIPTSYFQQPIEKIICKEYRIGYALQCAGIKFYKYENDTLKEICNKNKVSSNQISMWLNLVKNTKTLQLTSFNKDTEIHQLIQFLKFSHNQIFIKKLNYLLELVENTDDTRFNTVVTKNLKIIFPLFVQDFCQHMQEEENILFKYIYYLMEYQNMPKHIFNIYFQIKNYSISEQFQTHLKEDDEMKIIREITNNYEVNDETTPYTRLLFMEFKEIEKELIDHSKIENELLFPKAIKLEKKVKEWLYSIAIKN